MSSRSRRGWLGVLAAAGGLAGFLFLLPTPAAIPPPAAPLPSVAFEIRDVRLFDGERVVEHATVRISEGRISGIERAGKAVAAGSLPVIDGSGRTLLPGLIDAHTHSWGAALERAIVFGVTTQLDQFGDLELARQSRAAPSTGADLFTAGTLITRAGGHGTQFRPGIATLEAGADADAFVAARLAEGSDWIKLVLEDGHELGLPTLLPTLDATAVQAVVAAAHRRKALVVAHVHALEAAEMAVSAGVDGLVHTVVDTLPTAAWAQSVAARKVFVIPTLSVLGGSDESQRLARDARLLPFLNRAEIAQLAAPGVLSEMAGGEARSRSLARGSVRIWRAAGVKLLAGTDAANPGTTWGASLHGELELLVNAGLSPVEALAAATAFAADAFRLQDRGRIAVGKRADLLLVEGDPTRDIRAARAIVGVWKNGRAMNRLLAAAAPYPRLAERATEGFEAGKPAHWTVTTDAARGGASSATLSVRHEDSSGHFLRVDSEVRDGFPFPWAGALWTLADTATAAGDGHLQPVDLGLLTELSFRARGSAGDLMVLVEGLSRPMAFPIEASETWRNHRLDLKALGVPTEAVMAILFAAGPELGRFTIELDDVVLSLPTGG